MTEKIKVSIFVKNLLQLTEATLYREDQRLLNKFQDNRDLFDKSNELPLNLSGYFTLDQTHELSKLLQYAIVLSHVNTNSVVECHRLSYIRSTALLLVSYGLAECDIDLNDDTIFKNIVLEVLPDCKFYQ